MDAITGIAVFALGGAVGALLTLHHYQGYLKLFRTVSKRCDQEIEAERRYGDEMGARLHARELTIARMEQDKACESSWCDGYEAGLRAGMQGQTVSDVIAFTRLRCARRVRAEE